MPASTPVTGLQRDADLLAVASILCTLIPKSLHAWQAAAPSPAPKVLLQVTPRSVKVCGGGCCLLSSPTKLLLQVVDAGTQELLAQTNIKDVTFISMNPASGALSFLTHDKTAASTACSCFVVNGNVR